MRRRLVALAATIVAMSAAIVSFGLPRGADAGTPPPTPALWIDCDLSTGGIQPLCTYPSGTLSVTVAVILEPDTPFTLGTFNFTVVAPNAGFLPPTVGSGLDANPDFTADTTGLADWACGPPNPSADTGADLDPSTAQSFLSCFNGSGTGTSVSGNLELGRITYNVSSDGVRALAFDPVAGSEVNDDGFAQIIFCPGTAMCTGAVVQIGASAATATPTNTALPTNTAVPTSTPCVGATCPTPTSLAYKTVTPTGTVTVPAADTPVPGAPTTAPPPATGGAPGGTTSGGGTGGIRLPDTGMGATSSRQDTQTIAVALAVLLAAVALAGSLSLSAVAARRRWED